MVVLLLSTQYKSVRTHRSHKNDVDSFDVEFIILALSLTLLLSTQIFENGMGDDVLVSILSLLVFLLILSFYGCMMARCMFDLEDISKKYNQRHEESLMSKMRAKTRRRYSELVKYNTQNEKYWKNNISFNKRKDTRKESSKQNYTRLI